MSSDAYRILTADDVIEAGDEYDACRDPWRDEPKWRLVHAEGPRGTRK